MKKIFWILVFAVLLLNVKQTRVWSCSDFLLNNSGDSVVSARTMDFDIPLEADVLAVPRGETFQSALSESEKFMSWTSKYGFVGTNVAHLYAFTDGINEKGLSVATLWLGATEYPDITNIPKEKIIQIGDVAHWILGNFATVSEVKEGLKNVVVAGAPVKEINNMLLPLHLAIHDANKGSIVVEFVGGSMQVYDNPYLVTTNDPPFPGQIENLKNYQHMTNQPVKDPLVSQDGYFCGMNGLPGDSIPAHRFVRIYTLNRFVRNSKTDREAINNANHIMNRVTLVNDEAVGRSTEYGIIRDHKNLIYYVVDDENMNLRAVDLKKIDFSEKAPGQKMSIAADNWFVPADSELKPY